MCLLAQVLGCHRRVIKSCTSLDPFVCPLPSLVHYVNVQLSVHHAKSLPGHMNASVLNLNQLWRNPGFAGPARLSTGFDFTSLAQAAGPGLPQMPPMPKGVATLEDLERSARAPPGFGGQPNQPPTASHTFAGAGHAAVLLPGSAAQPTPVLWAAPDAGAPENAAAQDSGKALLTLLSKAAPTTAPVQQQPGSMAITSPPGFPAPTKPPQAPSSWGSSSQLQGIWGAPTPSSSGSQALWGAPVPEARSSPAQPQLPQAYSLHSHTAGQEAAGAQPQGLFSPLMQTAASTPGSLPEQPNSTMQVHFGTAGQLDPPHRAGSGPMQPESDSIRGSVASSAANPLLALLGQHRTSMSQGMPRSVIVLKFTKLVGNSRYPQLHLLLSKGWFVAQCHLQCA